jgi:transposase
MQAVVHAADLQDRDGGVLLMGTLFGVYPFLLKLYADAGYLGPKFQDGLKAVCRTVNVEIVRHRDLHTFVVLPKRWIVERTIAWFKRCRRLTKDWECRNRSALAFLRSASVRLMLRRLCQKRQMIPDGLSGELRRGSPLHQPRGRDLAAERGCSLTG